ncbi:MAG: lytic transglycosylase domain-containing protein [Luteimonas sp.]
MFAIGVAASIPAVASTGVRDTCIASAAVRYGVPPDLIRAIIKTEGGTTGQTVGNSNGSRDMGLMQVNTIHLPMLARFGISREMVVNDECLNIQLGTFILQRELSRGGDFWTNVGAYNSRTPEHNVRYRAKVWNNLQKILQGR